MSEAHVHRQGGLYQSVIDSDATARASADGDVNICYKEVELTPPYDCPACLAREEALRAADDCVRTFDLWERTVDTPSDLEALWMRVEAMRASMAAYRAARERTQ